MEQFSRPRTNGIIAISISEGDNLIEAKLTTGSREIVLANKKGRAIRFNESKVRSMGRNAGGVRGMVLEPNDDAVVGMLSLDLSEEKTILVVSEKGNGKRSLIEDYRLTNRGGKGVKSMQITEKTGDVVSIKAVSEDDDLMITSKSGIVIRLSVSDLRVMGRATQGVRVIRLSDSEEIADLAVVSKSEEIEEAEVVEGEESTEGVKLDENPENTAQKGESEEE
jgi:DNA gyrase subunit A